MKILLFQFFKSSILNTLSFTPSSTPSRLKSFSSKLGKSHSGSLAHHGFMMIAFSKIYPACQTDENGIKPGSNLNNADKRVAEPSRAEIFGMK